MKRFSLAIAAAVLAAALVVPARPALADTTFDFYGAGWGHALGMGQYGAYGMAKDGWKFRKILRHFYSNTSIDPAPSPPLRIRVGLLNGDDSIPVGAEQGTVSLWLNAIGDKHIADIPSGETWTIRLRKADAGYWVKKPNGAFVKNKGWGKDDSKMFVKYGDTGALAHLDDKSHSYGNGYLEFNIYEPCAGCSVAMRVINRLSVQTYLYGLAEVPSSWPTEVLRAQASAGRTYALSKVEFSGQHRDACNCAVYDSTSDQVFVGSDKQNDVDGDRWVSAVDDTKGLVVLQGGAITGGYYMSSSGGYTENNENIWGGTPLDYLRGVCDPGDWNASNSNKSWTVSKSGTAVGDDIESYTGETVGKVTSFSGEVRGVSGRLISVTAHGTQGTVDLSGSELKSALGLKDTRFWIEHDKIVNGQIRDKYDSLECAPGIQTSVRHKLDGGRYQKFDKGRVDWNRSVGEAFWVHGPIADKYVKLGAEDGFLGFPLTDVVVFTNPSSRRVRFDGGWIYNSTATGAHEVHGIVLDEYKVQGSASGKLGLPTSDVDTGGGEQTSTFQHGTITCITATEDCTTTIT